MTTVIKSCTNGNSSKASVAVVGIFKYDGDTSDIINSDPLTSMWLCTFKSIFREVLMCKYLLSFRLALCFMLMYNYEAKYIHTLNK